jgi:predicted dehydrogenase
VFVDKPCAASLADAIEIFRLAKEQNVPLFSSSSLRFAKDTQAVHGGSIGKVLYAETTSPLELEPHHPELFWYGVHGVESLFTVMGTGCETVQRGVGTNGAREFIARKDKKFTEPITTAWRRAKKARQKSGRSTATNP